MLRLFSNRNRPFHLGQYPMERLARTDLIDVLACPLPEHASIAGEQTGHRPQYSLSKAIEPYAKLFTQFRDGSIAPKLAEIAFDPAVLSPNIKASCYFLDATMVGICEIPERVWRVAAPGGSGRHRFAVVILVEFPRDPARGDPGADWIAGTQDKRAELRAAEIAVVVAGYIRRLGTSARAHTGIESEADHDALVVLAGLGYSPANGGRPINPFIGRRYGTAVLSTDLPLEIDRPLAGQYLRDKLVAKGPSYWLGTGGTITPWVRRRAARRPLHYGRHPMEQIKRSDLPTTLITDQVKRVPRRAGFFVRAELGDLGTKAKTEMTRARFALKHPLANAMVPLMLSMAPMQEGETASETAPGTDDPKANSDAIKAAAYYLGVDMAGICAVPEYAWFSHRQSGAPIEPYHKLAIVMLIDQGFETLDGSSGDDWISATQSMRGYVRGEEIGGILARHIRALGYPARSQTNQDSDVLHIPLILLAGLGEMSRIGELVLNPFVGPRFKSVVVTTDIPLAVDKPIDFGLQDFCSKCVKCARECPCDAIPHGDKVMFNGYEIWKPDIERCVRYRLTNAKGSACGRCMKMCPFNTEGLLTHRAVLWSAIKLPWTRRSIARFDDRVGKGRRNPIKRWWFDLEIVGDVAVRPIGTNERDLDLGKHMNPAKQKIAIYTPDMNPRPDQLDAVPVDRKEALRKTAALETPTQARRRLGI